MLGAVSAHDISSIDSTQRETAGMTEYRRLMGSGNECRSRYIRLLLRLLLVHLAAHRVDQPKVPC